MKHFRQFKEPLIEGQTPPADVEQGSSSGAGVGAAAPKKKLKDKFKIQKPAFVEGASTKLDNAKEAFNNKFETASEGAGKVKGFLCKDTPACHAGYMCLVFLLAIIFATLMATLVTSRG